VSSQAKFKYIVRIANTDIDGKEKVIYALAQIKGIGVATARAICKVLGIDQSKRFGELSDSEIKKIENLINEKSLGKVPNWLLNRRKDYETGNDMHLVSSELIFYARQDIEREKKTRSWRGVRHSLELKVRGQRTRTTGRFGASVGVKKKRVEEGGQTKEKKG
jgi:small subunit ribosomal protein S13